MITEKRTESGIGEAVGSWDLRLIEGTPKTVLDALDLNSASARFATLVITPARVDHGALSAATLRSLACYVGVLRNRTSELSIAGAGVAAMLGNEDGSSETPTAAVTLSATVLSTALDSYLPTNGITKGSVTNTGTSITDTLPGYVSRRDLIHQIVDKCGGEWRLTTDTSGNIDLDAAVNATLFGSTPPAMVIETDGGREAGIIGLEAVDIDQSHDIEDFATKQYVMARADGGVTVGSATSGAGTSYFNGTAIKMEAVTDSSDTDGTNANTVATLLLGSRQTIKRNIRVTVNPLDIVGKTWGPSGASKVNVRCGDSLYIYDPVNNLYDTANQVAYRGEVRFPLKTRIYGITWPVLGGMGVYLLTADSSPTVIDLSDWYVPESGSATLEVGAQVRSVFSSGPSAPLSPYGDMPTSLVSDARTSWTPSMKGSGSNPTLTSPTGEWRRMGTDIWGSFEITINNPGTGTYKITGPAAFRGTRQRDVGSVTIYDASTGATYRWALRTVGDGSADLFLFGPATYGGAGVNMTQTVPFTVATGDYIEGSFFGEAATS
jgi:hypothetical protein